MHPKSLASAIVMLLLCPGVGADAPVEAARTLPGFIRAELTEPPEPPDYPRRELQAGREGWVRLSFIIGADGVPTDIVVEDSNRVPRFESAARRWAASLRYHPATLDGEPIAQAVNHYRVQFDLTDRDEGVSRQVMRIYRSGRRALLEGDLDGVREALDRAALRPGLNLYEEAYLEMLRGLWCRERGELQCTISAMSEALTLGRDNVEDEVLANVAQALLVEQLRSGRFRGARSSYERVVELLGEEEATRLFAAPMAELERIVASDEPIQIRGTLESRGAAGDGRALWIFSPARRKPALLSVDGTLDSLEIRCDARQSHIRPQPGRAWRIPEHWGACSLFFFGAPGTTVLLEDMHLQSASAQ